MKRINTVVFDYDGTIHDTSKIYIAAFKKCYENLVRYGYAEKHTFADNEITKYLGCTAKEMWDGFMPNLPQNIKTLSMNLIRDEMARLIDEGKSSLYDGVYETLSDLKSEGRKTIILSNCAVGYMQNHRKHFHLDELFDGYFCAEEYGYAPKYEIFEHIKREYDGEFCVVGDRYHDFEAGLRNGALSVGCRYGFGNDTELSKADKIIDGISELKKIIYDYEK